jgi:site-specific DNA recombinase
VRDLIERHVERVTITSTAVEVRLMSDSALAKPGSDEAAAGEPPITTLTLAWTAPSFAAVKGIVHEPVVKPAMKPENRDALLAAIAKARQWIDDLRFGRAATLAEIADREGIGERYVRLLAPLAFVAPRLVAAIADGTAPADLTVSGLAKSVPYGWAEQESKCLAAVAGMTSGAGR